MHESPVPGAPASKEAREAFRRLLDLPDEHIPLAEAALRIAQEEVPGLDVAGTLERLTAMKRELLADLPGWCETGGSGPGGELTRGDRLRGLRNFLFGENGWRPPREEDYFDPRNSLLHEVLERRTGLPILISLVFLELGRAIGLRLVGVSFPGHFLVKTDDDGPELLLDPTNRGREVSPLEAMDRLEQFFGDKKLPDEYTQPASTREILFRLLANLKVAYVREKSYERAFGVVDRLLLLEPGAYWERRDRGLLAMELGWYHRARQDFEAYLAAAPDAKDREPVEQRLEQARLLGPLLN